MRRPLHTGMLLLLVLVSGAVRTEAAEITVQVVSPPAGGSVVLMLFDSAAAFGDRRDPVMERAFPADGREMFALGDVAPGEYALMVYHDEDGNGRLDENFIGIPREPVGFSNGYRPKGPPQYARARFVLGEERLDIDVRLERPLGKRGRLGVGMGVIGQSSPYRGAGGGVYQPIPALSYIGERVQIFGPRLQVGLAGSGDLRLAAVARYRLGAYEEDDSPVLQGLGDRESTLMAGLAVEYELPAGVDLSARFEHDVLGEIGGGAASLSVDKSFPWGIARITPRAAVNWLSADLADHDFGVPEDRAMAGRPAYDVGDTVSLEAGVGVFVEVTRDWRVIVNVSVEFLGDDVTDSPIVEEGERVKGFAAVNYVL